MLKYEKLLKEWDLDLDSDVLDKAFVEKAKKFQKQVANNELKDEEIKAADEELVQMFNELHEFEEESDPELVETKKKVFLLEAKTKIAEAETLDELEEIKKEYKDKFDEIEPVFTARFNKMKNKIAEAINSANADKLPGLLEKYKGYSELKKLIENRIKEEEQKRKPSSLKETLLKKREWTYKELRELGIEPTGNDMIVEGLKLEKEYLFNIYSVRK